MRLLTLSLLLCWCGCATSEPAQVTYDASRDVSNFTSSRILVGNLDGSTGLTSAQRVMARAVASCPRSSCTPNEVYLVFYNASDSDLHLDHRRLEITYDGATETWDDLDRRGESPRAVIAKGEFIRVPIQSYAFARLAHAEHVKVAFGTTGTTVFNVLFERRAPWRALAEQMGIR